MPILSTRPEQLEPAYGILCQAVFPQPHLSVPFGATYCVVKPGESTDPHAHHEGESFYIVSGRGRMSIAGEPTREVASGDVALIPSFARHGIHNESTTENLVFFSIYWEEAAPRPLPTRTSLYVAPPTPNGDLHLGHLSGPYLAADVHARYLRLRGVEARYLSGSDDHQGYVATKADALGTTPEAVAARFGSANANTLRKASVQLDSFQRPSQDPDYIRFVQAFFQRLAAEGSLELRQAPSLHCETCDRYLYEAHVRGGCPICGTETSGNGCEQCYWPNDCVNLLDPVCAACGNPAVVRQLSRYYFPLARFGDRLATFHQSVAMGPHLRALSTDLLSQGLPDISISHVADWGIQVPGMPGQVLYEWFEMAAGFLYAAQQASPDGRWESVWKDDASRVVQAFGFDNSFFFVAFLPAVLLAYDPAVHLPEAFLHNEFYQLDGTKFSTSRRHAIWADEALEALPADVLRFFLGYDRPEVEQTSFTLPGMRGTVEQELVGRWEAWLAELDARLDLVGRVAPEFREPANHAEQNLWQHLSQAIAALDAAYRAETFSLRSATRELGRLVDVGRGFGQAMAPLQGQPVLREDWHAAIALELVVLKVFSVLVSPVMPSFGTDLQERLGLEELDWTHLKSPIPDGTRVGALRVTDFSGALHGIDRLIEQPLPSSVLR